MGNYLTKSLLACLFSVSLLSAPACSAPSEMSEANAPEIDNDITAVLEQVPEGILTRFILTVSTEADGKIDSKRVDAVLASLKEAGAKAEWLDGTPVVFVTCEKAAIYAALDTGHVSTVQVDQLRKPME